MTAPARRNAALASAAELYERLVLSGELKCDAFRTALNSLRLDSGGKPLAVVPVELPDLVSSIVRSQVSGDWQTALAEVTSGRSRRHDYTRLRDLVSYVLTKRGYHPREIGSALSRDRSTIIVQVRAFEARMKSDELLRARVERLLAARGVEVAA